jgi:hypothetical protein
MLALPVTRYRLTAIFEEDLLLPDYAGSLLRGVFGAALRRTACMTGLPDCKACPLWRTCPYPAIFETPPRPTHLAQRFSQVPNPYVIEPPPIGTRAVAAGEPLFFHMVLIGAETLAQLPLVIHAWRRAFAHGLGTEPRRSRGLLRAVQGIGPAGEVVDAWEADSGKVLPHVLHWSASAPSTGAGTAGEVVIDIHTPLRLQHEGRALGPRELSPRVLVSHLLRRIGLLLQLHLGVTDLPYDVPTLLKNAERLADDRDGLRWKDWTRYSSRQQQEMTLGGVIGRWALRGDVTHLLPWLHLGQCLHLGKNATMGMGGYALHDAARGAGDP